MTYLIDQNVFGLLVFVSSVSPLAGGHVTHFWRIAIRVFLRPQWSTCAADLWKKPSSAQKTDERLQRDRLHEGELDVQKDRKHTNNRTSMLSLWMNAKQLLQRCARGSSVDPGLFEMTMKSLNYSPRLSSKILLIQQNPMCSVRFRAELFGIKYVLYLVLLSRDDLRLVL